MKTISYPIMLMVVFVCSLGYLLYSKYTQNCYNNELAERASEHTFVSDKKAWNLYEVNNYGNI